MRYLLFLLLVVTASPSMLWGQKIEVSEGLSLRNDNGYDIIGRLRDRTLLFRDRFDDYEIQAFDEQLRASWSRKLEDIDKRNTKILSVLPGKNDFSIIYAQKLKGKYYLKIHKYDPGAILIDSMTIKTYGERLFSPPELEILISDDRSKVVVYNTAEKAKLEIVCFQVDLMKVLWDKTASFEDAFMEETFLGLALSNKGILYVALEYDNKKSKIESHRFQILQVSEGADIIGKYPFPDAITSDVKFVFDNQNNRLLAGGLWSEKRKERTNGGFFFSCDLQNPTSYVLKKTQFDEQFISTIRQKDIEDGSKGIDDSDVAHLIPRADGGLAMVVERHYEIQRGTAGSSRVVREVRNIIDYYYDDFFLLSFGADGTMQWNTILHKKQYSQDDDGIFSSFFLFKGRESLQFLFNDEIRYENSCSTYEVSANGAFDRNSLLNTLNQNLRMRFRDGLQLSANECLIPSEYRSKLKLVSIRF
jgi:hypothetical protein